MLSGESDFKADEDVARERVRCNGQVGRLGAQRSPSSVGHASPPSRQRGRDCPRSGASRRSRLCARRRQHGVDELACLIHGVAVRHTQRCVRR